MQAGLPSPRFVGRARARDGGVRRCGDAAYPVRLEAAGDVGQPGRDPREHVARIRRRRSIASARCWRGRQVRAARAGLEDQILVEEYIDGREFALEGVLTDGALQIFAIFDKPDPLEGPFFEETIYVTPSRAGGCDARRAIADACAARGRALGLCARARPRRVPRQPARGGLRAGSGRAPDRRAVLARAEVRRDAARDGHRRRSRRCCSARVGRIDRRLFARARPPPR